ncbi:MAG: hypothetical protein H7A46_15225 [Verrucomicrobiales bacterium]|nr:hypothetical protein [Verrucomicrobiales bacterium]
MRNTSTWNRLSSVALGLGCLIPALALGPADVDQAIVSARAYHIGAPGTGFREVQQIVQATHAGDPLRLNLEQQLLDLVVSEADIEARRLACRTLWIIGGEASVEPLLKRVEDPVHCDMACYALRNHPAQAVNAGLVATLPGLSGNPRIAVINLLGDRRAREAVGVLSDFTAAGDPILSEAALAALGRIGSPAAARALMERWSATGADASPALLDAALQCAQRLEAARPRIAARIYGRMMRLSGQSRLRAAGLLGRVRIGGPAALTLLSEALGNEDDYLATTALSQIGTLPGEDVTAIFVRRLETLPVERQGGLLRALTARDDRSLLPIAVKHAAADDEALAVAAIEALGRFGDASVTPLLIGVVSEKAGSRRAAAVAALRELRGHGVDEALLNARLPEDDTAAVALVGVIADRGITDAVSSMLQTVGIRTGAVEVAEFRALARLASAGDLRAVASTLRFAEAGEGLTAATECLRQVALKHPDAGEASRVLLEQYAVTPAPPERAALLQVLASLADPRGLAALTAALYDGEGGLPGTALRLLADWPEVSALPTLMAIARAEGGPKERIIALRGALRLLAEARPSGTRDLLRDYREALFLAQRDEERRLALAGLGATGLPEATDLVLPFLKNFALRAEAAHAVLAIARQTTPDARAATHAALRQVLEADVPDNLKVEARKLLEPPDAAQ